MSATMSARDETIVRLTREGQTLAQIAEQVGVTGSRVWQIRRQHGVVAPRWSFQERSEALEDALALGLTISQALADAGWSNPAAAARAYWRAGRPLPAGLSQAVHRQNKARREATE